MTGIKGLTDQYTAPLDTNVRGKPVRIGYLQKGEKRAKNPNRPAYGKNIQLVDLDYFKFRPLDDGPPGDEMRAIFHDVYGEEPRVIDDVRIPVSIADNFKIEQCATALAMKYTESGAIFMAQGDREYVYRYRDAETGKVVTPDEPIPFAEMTAVDANGNEHFIYRDGDRYQWQNSMAIDLMLVDFNQALYEAGLAGAGVVTLITHAANDIATLIGEYYQILEEVAGIFANPTDEQSVRQAMRWAPLRDIPLRLERRNDPMTRPNYNSDDPGDRIASSAWLLHWQLNPEFAAAAERARRQRTAKLLEFVGNAGMLAAGPDRRQLEAANADLFDKTTALPAGDGEEAANEPEEIDWEEIVEAEVVTGGDDDDNPFGETEKRNGGTPRSPAFWKEQAAKAQTLDGLASAIFHLHRPAGVFDDAAEVKRGFKYMCGDYPENVALDAKRRVNAAGAAAFDTYVNMVADGVKKRKAADTGREVFAAVLSGDTEEE